MTPIQAKGVLEVSIGRWNTSHDILVADIYDECILGMDFLQKYECLVDLKKGRLQINKEEIPRVPAVPSSCCRIMS